MVESRNWNEYNSKLVNRGRSSTYINPALLSYEEDLSKLNKRKIGAPYQYTTLLIIAGFAIKSIFKVGYREAAGNVADYVELAGMKQSPDFRTIQWRISEMKKEGIKFMIYQKDRKHLDVIIDASGIKSVNDGEYRSTKYEKIKIWEKIHLAIDPDTHKILNMEITENNVGDTTIFTDLLDPIKEANKVDRVTTDGAYDSEKNFRYCEDNEIEPRIPVHINATGTTGRYRRKYVVEQLGVDRRRGNRFHKIPPLEQRRENQENWKNRSGYHERSLVESAFSVFKGAFGEYTFSKSTEMKEKELLLKAVVYNKFLT